MASLFKIYKDNGMPFLLPVKQIFVYILLILSFFINGCSPLQQNKKIVYHAKYTEYLEDGILIDSHFVMIPIWEYRSGRFTVYTVKSQAEKSSKFSLDVTLWHNAVKNLLLIEGQKIVNAKSIRSSFDQKDNIIMVHEGYVVSPPISAKTSLDKINYEAYGTYEIEFAAAKSEPSFLMQLFTSRQRHR